MQTGRKTCSWFCFQYCCDRFQLTNTLFCFLRTHGHIINIKNTKINKTEVLIQGSEIHTGKPNNALLKRTSHSKLHQFYPLLQDHSSIFRGVLPQICETGVLGTCRLLSCFGGMEKTVESCTVFKSHGKNPFGFSFHTPKVGY